MVALKDGIQSADAIERLAEAASSGPRRRSRRTRSSRRASTCGWESAPIGCGRAFCRVRNHTVSDRLVQLSYPRNRPLRPGAILETGSVYIARAAGEPALPADLSAAANPKSSTGRIDVFTRVITDRSQEFDTIGAGYQGRSIRRNFAQDLPGSGPHGHAPVAVAPAQGRVVRLNDAELHALHARERIVTSAEPSIQDGVAVSVDLAGFGDRQPDRLPGQAPYRLVDVDKPGSCLRRRFLGAALRQCRPDPDPGSGPVLHPRLQGSRPRSAGLCCRDGAFRSRWSASSAFITPGSSIRVSATRPPAARAPARCSKCAPAMCPSSWRRPDRRAARVRAHGRAAERALRRRPRDPTIRPKASSSPSISADRRTARTCPCRARWPAIDRADAGVVQR